jgi:hypothetical protein
LWDILETSPESSSEFLYLFTHFFLSLLPPSVDFYIQMQKISMCTKIHLCISLEDPHAMILTNAVCHKQMFTNSALYQGKHAYDKKPVFHI